jgi:probable DNA repair protein
MNMLDSLFKANTVVLTPNQRLTATLLKKYNRQQILQGKSCWPTVDLLPLASWIQRLWNQYTATHMDGEFLPLTANQELLLWEDIITQAPESEHLLKISDLAQQAKTAWSTLHKWCSDFRHPAFSLTENSRVFQQWAQQFADRCQQQKWLDTASLTAVVTATIRQQKLVLPAELVLLNFTEFTPEQRILLKACEEQGIRVQQETLSVKARMPPVLLALQDENEELHTLARWARQTLEQQPEATIGCIAAALEEKREAWLAVFSDIFPQQDRFNISAGKTLAAYPLIQHALQFLLLPLKTVSIQTLNFLLPSPYLGDAEKEMVSRIHWDSQLRYHNITQISWEVLLKTTHNPACSSLIKRLQLFLEKRRSEPHTQTTSQWIDHFAQLLVLLGWPGENSLNSAEYQVAQSWMRLLKEAAGFDKVLPAVSYNKALHYVTLLAAKTFFQPESPEAPIQILGQLEGAGIPFDYLWVTGMNDRAWPPVPNPNPFIPHELQKRLQMPNATAERQLDYSRKLTAQFKQAAPTVIFSYTQHQEQEDLHPSPLLTDLHQLCLEDLKLPPHASAIQRIFFARSLETINDEQALPLRADEKIRGGASIFEMQATCPFKAFAKLRLHARTVEEAQAGLPAKIRGSIMHRVLELFWREVKNQAQLLAMDNEQLTLKIKAYLNTAILELAPFLPTESLYYRLVTQRFENLLQQWLALEKARPPFKVLAQEQEKTIIMNAFEFKLRIDRIDALADGATLIIDYKTKKSCDTHDWFGERPTEPQLPLYCITSAEPPAGLAFAQIHASTVQLKGLSQKCLDLPEIKTFSEKSKADATSWEGQLAQWQLHLRQLFANFQTGTATIDPKNKQSCDYCDLQTLCRIYET